MDAQDPLDAFRRFEHQGWMAVAREYRDSFGPLTLQAAPALLDATEVGPGTRLLDLACGPGYVAAAAASRGARATGLDFSAAMIGLAREHAPEVEFIEGDAERLPFPEGVFDAVTINFGMPHFAHPDQVLREAARVLVPGGRLVYSTWASAEKVEVIRLLARAIDTHGNRNVPLPAAQPVYRFSDAQASAQALREAGFVEPRVAELPLLWRLASVSELLTAMRSATIRTGRVLRAQTAEALARIERMVADGTPHYRTGTGAELPMLAVLSAGRKPRGPAEVDVRTSP